jgi:hypothetical protein
MKFHSELYILTEQVKPEYLEKLYIAISQVNGMLGTFTLTFRCTDNVVRYFVSSDKDLSGLSNKLEGLLFRPVDAEDVSPPTATDKERFLQFVTGGNLLDLKEKYKTQKGKDLEYAVFKVRTLSSSKGVTKSELYFKNAAGQWSKGSKTTTMFPVWLFAIDFSTNTHYLKKSVPRYLNIEKSLPMLSSTNIDSLLEVDTFPYFTNNYYLNLPSYEFDRHSFIIGASGSGKSKFISLYIDRLQKTAMRMNYRVIVIDPHAALAEDLAHIPETKVINFNQESTQLFSGGSSDITAAVELTSTLFKSLMADQHNPKLERLLRFSLYVLFTAQNMSLDTLKRFLTEVELRNQMLDHVHGYVPDNIIQFFGADFNEMRTKYANEAISPLVSMIDEMQLQPVLVGEGELSLAKTIQDNFLTVFSLNKVSMGEKVVKTVAGLLIQQIFLLAQARAFGQKVILIIDEVSIIQTPALAAILAEARKFNLSVILTQQYFGQIEKELQDAIFANVYNYYAFKVSEEDARALEGNLNIELPKEIVEEAHKHGLKEQDIRIKIMTELHPRELLARVLANGQVVPAIKARTADAPVAAAAEHVETQLQSYKQQPAKLPAKFQEQAIPARANLQEIEQEHGQASEPVPVVVPEFPTFNTDIAHSPEAAPNLYGAEHVPTDPEQEPGYEPETMTNHVAPEKAGAPPAQYSRQPAPSAGLFNLSDLLAQHSSSRIKLDNEDKS